ncbi:MAG: acyl-homoserine-lactone synthase [Patescibacteria group bacterium]
MIYLKSIQLRDGDLFCSDIKANDIDNLNKVFQLRHEIFVKNLKWVKNNDDKLESDKYDKNSIIFAVFLNKEILGTVRVILPTEKFMLEDDFHYLLDENHTIIKNKAIEISRLGVKSEIKDNPKLKKRVVMLLYKTLYKWASENDIRYFYFVSTEKFLNSLDSRFSIPIHLFKKIASAPNCPKYRAALIDLKESEKIVQKFKIAIYNFFTKTS